MKTQVIFKGIEYDVEFGLDSSTESLTSEIAAYSSKEGWVWVDDLPDEDEDGEFDDSVVAVLPEGTTLISSWNRVIGGGYSCSFGEYSEDEELEDE